MSKVKYKKVGTGVFHSPALNADAPYELVDVIEKRTVVGRAVRCLRSQQVFDVDVLSKPTGAQLADQLSAAFREFCAWLVANAPNNPTRHRAAMRTLRKLVDDNYLNDDLARDVAWIGSADLGRRIGFLRDHLDAPAKRRLIEVASRVGSTGGDLSETDAEFLERAGTGLGLPASEVYDIVVTAMTASKTAAA